MKKLENNIAFVDGQNLFLGTTKSEISWHIDLVRFRVYLQQKYLVTKAYYFLGFVHEEYQKLYEQIQEAGFILVFRQHHASMLGAKKGNVDTDIVFHIMKKMYKNEDFSGIVLVSGDGDYKMMVDFLIEEKRFKKLLFPDQKRASSLYKNIALSYRANLSEKDVRKKIEQKEKGSLGN